MTFTPKETKLLTAALAVYSHQQLLTAKTLGDHPSRKEHEEFAAQAQSLMTKIISEV